jgi:hypothetical protein
MRGREVGGLWHYASSHDFSPYSTEKTFATQIPNKNIMSSVKKEI